MGLYNRLAVLVFSGMLLAGCSLFQPPEPSGKVEQKKVVQAEVVVYISGHVQKPGTYAVAKGSKVSSAIAAAGGLTQAADSSVINMDEIVSETIQVYVPAVGEAKTGLPVRRDMPTPDPDSARTVAESNPPPAPPRSVTIYRSGSSLSDLERQMIEMVNAERSKQGVKQLTVDDGLVKTARLKSQDMIDNSYFDHVSPRYGTMSELLSSNGITYRMAGENLAISGKLEQAHRGLMNSPGHRTNILNPPFTRIGIGIVQDGQRGLVITQHFAQ